MVRGSINDLLNVHVTESSHSVSFVDMFKKLLTIDQEVILKYEVYGTLLDKKDGQGPASGEDQESILSHIYPEPKTYVLRTPEEVYRRLNEMANDEYVRNWRGSITRPISLRVDRASVTVDLGKKLIAHYEGEPEFTKRMFTVKFLVKGMVQYGGRTGIGTPSEVHRALYEWAGIKD